MAHITHLGWDEAIEAFTQAAALLRWMKRSGQTNSARQRRNILLVALANMIGSPGGPNRQRAQEIARRLRRYRPHPDETSAERQLMTEITKASTKPLSAETIRKIIARTQI